MQGKISVVLLLLCCVVIVSCKKDTTYRQALPPQNYKGTVYEYLRSQPGNFKNVLQAIDKSGLGKMLTNDSVTLFAPTDQSLDAALGNYNVYRQTIHQPAVTLNDIDSSSWRSILGNYLFTGNWRSEDFAGQDGKTMVSAALRVMDLRLVQRTASGAAGLGSEVVRISHMNGSRFIKFWVSAFATTSDVHASNGMVFILEPAHVVGFNTFVAKVSEYQNLYSEQKTFADGAAALANGTITLWNFYPKKLKAIDAATVETEMANRIADKYAMRLTVHADNTVMVTAAPASPAQQIQNNGACFFDPAASLFNLNYTYTDVSGKVYQVTEVIRYNAIREQ
ncbi:fasciclin domain-containing protein [Chitinophaga sp.]|uniref:fasciclin domain-containing protein n=1 Tax=Chitinophaga sp. TaxID=1869181 RepID=UPI002F923D4F